MKILVLGATGPTGRLIVANAIMQGHEVAVLVRSKAKASDIAGAKVFEGDARDEIAITRAIAGCDAVISSLGTPMSPFREVTLLSLATTALVSVMKRQHVQRLICITGMGAGDSRGHGGFFYDSVFQPLLLGKVYQDKDRQEAIVKASGLDWTIIRPTVLNDKPARGNIRALTDLSGIHGGAISRADVADFVVRQVADTAFVQKTPLITW